MIRRWFGGQRRPSNALMVPANYFSMLVGLVLVMSFVAGRLNVDLYNLWSVHLMLYGAAFLITVLLEWPFVYGAIPAGPGRAKRSVADSVGFPSSSRTTTSSVG